MALKLASPRLGGRFPRQVKRTVPLYLLVVCGLFLLFGPPSWIPIPTQATSVVALKLAFKTHAITSSPKGIFPKKFWQIWKVPVLHFAGKDLARAQNWTDLNPTYRYEVLTDDNALPWVEHAYGPLGLDRPDVVTFYRDFKDHIIKADLLRYLIMYVDGGTYADIDVSGLKPIEDFIPEPYKKQEEHIDMVVGVEVDQPQYKDHPILGSKSMSFVQWTFMCKPRLPVMLNLVNHIMSWITSLAAEQKVSISNVTINFDQVISGSGPTAFTNAILAEMTRKEGTAVQWSRFHNMVEPTMLGGFLVLPVKAFAAGQGHSNSGAAYCPEANIKHHYHASKWPLTHPRYQHPIYGQLEDCSWNSTCIEKWEANLEKWKIMDPKIQQSELDRRKQGHAARLAREAKEEKEQMEMAAREAEMTVDGFCGERFPGVVTREVLEGMWKLDTEALGQGQLGQGQQNVIQADRAAQVAAASGSGVEREAEAAREGRRKFKYWNDIEIANQQEEEADAALLEEWKVKMKEGRDRRRKEREEIWKAKEVDGKVG